MAFVAGVENGKRRDLKVVVVAEAGWWLEAMSDIMDTVHRCKKVLIKLVSAPSQLRCVNELLFIVRINVLLRNGQIGLQGMRGTRRSGGSRQVPK